MLILFSFRTNSDPVFFPSCFDTTNNIIYISIAMLFNKIYIYILV